MLYPTTSAHIPAGRIATVCNLSIPGYRTAWHEHDEYMFLMPESGSLIVSTEADQRGQKLASRILAVIEPCVSHQTMTEGMDNRHTAVYVDKEFVAFCERKAHASVAGKRHKSGNSTLCFCAPTPSLVHSLQLYASLQQAAQPREFERYRTELIERLVASACIEAAFVARPQLSEREMSREAFAAQIVEYVDMTLVERPSLDEIALRFNISRRQLTRLFRETTGKSIAEFQMHRRVERAAALLDRPGTTVLDAALAVGVESASYLARLFDKHGMGKPGDYKH